MKEGETVAGRPRKTANALQGAYTKEAMKKRVEDEQAITGDNDNIIPPKFIENDEIALEEFYRVVSELKKVNIVTNVDSVMLGVYANCYSMYYRATIEIEEQDLITEYTNKGGATNSVVNPYIKIQQQYLASLMKISEKFGLDPSSRAKIAHLQPSEKDDKKDPIIMMAEKMAGLRK